MSNIPASTRGFDTRPQRHTALTLVLFAVVVLLAVSVAVAFKEGALWIVEQYGGSSDATQSAERLPALVTALIAAASTAVSAVLGLAAGRRWPGMCGLDAIAATARGDDQRISLRATLMRSLGVWLTLVGLVPIGRESAILETGGAIGSTLGRRFRGQGAAMAASGIAAAFAAAYHAPIAAIAYLEEHFRIRGSRRAVMFTAGGALGGFVAARYLFGSEPIFPSLHASASELLLAAAVAVVPATAAARAFLEARTRVTAPNAWWNGRFSQWHIVATGAVITGVVVAVWPAAAGNGNDSLRRVAAAAGIGTALAVAMLVGKSFGAASAFGAKAPGGALTPTMTVAAGASLLVALALRSSGLAHPDLWAVAVLAGSVAVAVGLRSPITAVLLLPEMMGHLTIIPATAAIVLVATGLDRLLDRAARHWGGAPPDAIQDEDG